MVPRHNSSIHCLAINVPLDIVALKLHEEAYCSSGWFDGMSDIFIYRFWCRITNNWAYLEELLQTVIGVDLEQCTWCQVVICCIFSL